ADRPDLAPLALPTTRALRMAYYFPQDPTSLTSLRANIRHLDVVAPHWLDIDGDGTVRSGQRDEVVAFLRSARVLVLPSVALATKDRGHAIVTDPDTRAYALDQLVAAAVGWDGLALDFEGMDADDRDSLTDFVNQLGRRLHQRQQLYAVALPAKTSDARTGWGGSYDYVGIRDAADLYLVMAYGYRVGTSSVPGSTAPLPWIE